MTKDILAPADITWSFTGPVPAALSSFDPNDWASGTSLLIPDTDLQNRDYFPVDFAVTLEVKAEFDEGVTLFAETSIQFLPSPVDLVTNPEVKSIIKDDERLIIDFSDSSTADNLQYSAPGMYTWEWEWNCITPGQDGQLDTRCRYDSGKELNMPSLNEERFESDNSEEFETGVPLLFTVRVRVLDSASEVVSEGKWQRLLNPVGNGGQLLELVGERWDCGDSTEGYSARILTSQGEIEESEILSLWTEHTDDFGNLEVLQVTGTAATDNKLTQVRCSCSAECSEPVFLQINVRLNQKDHTLHFIYEPSGILPPLQGDGCSTFIETYGGESEIISGLTFVGVKCDESFFADGFAANNIWYEVTDAGDGPVNTPAQYPPIQNYFAPQQFFLSCGKEVTIFTRAVGYGTSSDYAYPTPLSNIEVEVEPWQEGMENDFDEVEDIISNSPNTYLSENLGFAVVQTLSLPCYSEDDSFKPVDTGDVLDDILNSDIPDDVNDILTEATILSVLEITDPDDQARVIDRFQDYLDAVANTNGLVVRALGKPLTETASNILELNQDSDILDAIYDLVNNLEAGLLCTTLCGEDPVEYLNALLAVGTSLNPLENLQFIQLGELTFSLPTDLTELQENLGGEGACVAAGYSLITTETQVPAASLTFYSIDCFSGDTITWEEIPLTLSSDFYITIPITEKKDDEDDTEDCPYGEADDDDDDNGTLCVSGDAVSDIEDSVGCQLYGENRNFVTCACSHLTAFSALFADEEGKSNCAEWHWTTLQIIGLSFICTCVVGVIIIILVEHYFIYRPMMDGMTQQLETMKRQTRNAY